ncbi:cytochrome c-type biogenesis protein [Motilibacter rhizosphaerae]|uniref:Cytochrome c-type biogenesis protein n=1 Tax=Motilibacter rhizosphaerae TaxID=598652 RepID=A0A4Q7NA39_9ACTN|nr:cytochrome c biogenesis protein CcdA [Motilibacter rhizosphaerae]RZS79045.1 cytochrome c-type biogenesis protein [Motilibacter rhizosphaerae]
MSTITTGPLLLAAPLAAAAGLVSFLSPCVLPLVPGYLSYVTGLTGEELAERRRGRVVPGTVLFVLGFSAVFILEGVLTTLAARVFLVEHQHALQQVLGVLTILLGLAFAGALPGVAREFRLHRRPALGLAGAPMLGALFGLGWTPCVGPTLAAVLNLGAAGGDSTRSALLAAAYCLGLGLPFLVAGLAYRRALSAFSVVRRHSVWVLRFGGVMLVAIGLLLLSGTWSELLVIVQRRVDSFGPAL